MYYTTFSYLVKLRNSKIAEFKCYGKQKLANSLKTHKNTQKKDFIFSK